MANTVHPASDIENAWEAAFKASLTTKPSEQAAYLVETIGYRFTTAGIGLADARTVKRWVEEGAEPREHDVVARLNILYRLTSAVANVYGPSVAAAFLRSANPQLDDESPLLLLRNG